MTVLNDFMKHLLLDYPPTLTTMNDDNTEDYDMIGNEEEGGEDETTRQEGCKYSYNKDDFFYILSDNARGHGTSSLMDSSSSLSLDSLLLLSKNDMRNNTMTTMKSSSMYTSPRLYSKRWHDYYQPSSVTRKETSKIVTTKRRTTTSGETTTTTTNRTTRTKQNNYISRWNDSFDSTETKIHICTSLPAAPTRRNDDDDDPPRTTTSSTMNASLSSLTLPFPSPHQQRQQQTSRREEDKKNKNNDNGASNIMMINDHEIKIRKNGSGTHDLAIAASDTMKRRREPTATTKTIIAKQLFCDCNDCMDDSSSSSCYCDDDDDFCQYATTTSSPTNVDDLYFFTCLLMADA